MLLLCFVFLPLTVFSQPLTGSWKGTLQAGSTELTLILHIDQASSTSTLAVVEQGNEVMPMTVHLLTDDSVSVSLPPFGLSIDGRLANEKIKATFHQQTFSAPMTFKRGDVALSRPQEPKPPFPYQTKPVRFVNEQDHASLAGTLTLPEGYTQGQRPPVVLMVTGSGPQDRDETMFGHKPFLVIADWLARHGIASLRYDDRGVGQSDKGETAVPTTMDLAKDAAAGIDCLRKMNAFSKVGVLGHSEGGMIAYMLGSEGYIDFIVSLAGPACKIDTMMVLQLNGLARVQGARSDVIHSVSEARNLMLSQDASAWMKAFLDIDMQPYVQKTSCPVLALGGSSDLNVPVSLNGPALNTGLPRNDKTVIKVYEGLNHCFQHDPTGNPLNISKIEETISPEVLQDICKWLNAL